MTNRLTFERWVQNGSNHIAYLFPLPMHHYGRFSLLLPQIMICWEPHGPVSGSNVWSRARSSKKSMRLSDAFGTKRRRFIHTCSSKLCTSNPQFNNCHRSQSFGRILRATSHVLGKRRLQANLSFCVALAAR